MNENVEFSYFGRIAVAFFEGAVQMMIITIHFYGSTKFISLKIMPTILSFFVFAFVVSLPLRFRLTIQLHLLRHFLFTVSKTISNQCCHLPTILFTILTTSFNKLIESFIFLYCEIFTCFRND